MDSEPASVISEDLFHIALLIDQLRHDDTNVRNTAAKSLTRIGKDNDLSSLCHIMLKLNILTQRKLLDRNERETN